MDVNIDNYVELAKSTLSDDYNKIVERLSYEKTIQLLHAAMGLVTESAEVMDIVKKHIFYGKEMDFKNVAEEIGDNQWYAAIAIDILDETFKNILTKNIEKLRKRYPEKFTEYHANNRNVENELNHY